MRLVSAITVVLRRLRAERGTLALVFVLVAVTSGLVAVVPRLFEQVADAGLRDAVSKGTSLQRNLQFTEVDRIRPGDKDRTSFIRARGDDTFGRLPVSVASLIADRGFVVETPRFGLVGPPNYPTFETLRYQDGVGELVRYDEGRAPAALAAPAPDAPARIEIAVSRPNANETHLAVGDVVTARLDPNDPLIRPLFPRPVVDIELAVVGIFDVLDPKAAAWYDDPAFDQPAIGGSDDSPIAFTTALVAPEAYGSIEDLGLPTRYRWRMRVDPARLDASQLGTLVPDLHRLDTTFSTTGTGARGLVYRSGLLDLIDTYRTERAATEAVLSVAAIGPLSVAAGALGLVALIVIRRRRAALALARGRGASAGQLLAAQLWEGLLVTIPAALVGLEAARIAVPARDDSASAVGAVLVGLAVTTLLVLATWPPARRARPELERDDTPVHRPSIRRLVLEATIVVVALGSAWLLRERGLGAARAGADPTSFDPLLAAAPLLIGVAVALLTLRLYPLPIRVLAWLGAQRRDLVPALGLRSIGRDPASAYLPLLVVTLTVGIGAFSSVLAGTIERGQVAASWDAIGADLRVETTATNGFSDDLDLTAVPGVEASAPMITTSTSRLRDVPGRTTPAPLLAVDPAAYAAVLAGSPAAHVVPPQLFAAPTGPGAGTKQQPIPIVLSRRLPVAWDQVPVGGTFEVGIAERPIWFTVADIVDDLPGQPPGTPFLLAPIDSVRASEAGGGLHPDVLLVRGPASVEAPIRTALGDLPIQVTSRHALLESMRDAPLVDAVRRGFGVAVIAAAVYAALAIVAVLTLDARRRARELAFLRTLGFTSGQSVSLTFVEHAPPTLVALLVGLGFGLGVAWLLEPGLGLGSFIGPGADVRLQIDWPTIAGIAGLVVIAILLMVLVSSWSARRLDASRALRIGDA